MPTTPTSQLAPVALTFLSAILWGVWWIPIRYLEVQGLSGAQAGMLMNLGAAGLLIIYIAVSRTSLRIGSRAIAGAALVGVAAATYSVALTLSDVVRVILLFYIAPAWGKIIEWAFMGRRWHWSATVTLAMSLSGAFLVLGGDVSLASLGAGDLMAVGSGVAWAVGAALIFTGAKSSALPLTLATVLAAALVAALVAALRAEAIMPMVPVLVSLKAALVGAAYVLPILFLTLWSAQRLSPALLSFLFTMEILSGVASGALLLDEVFGLMQAAGGALIILAALSEVVFALRPQIRKTAG